MMETKPGEEMLSGIKEELFNMQEYWDKQRGKDGRGNFCVGRRSMVPT